MVWTLLILIVLVTQLIGRILIQSHLPPFTLPIDEASTVNCLVDAQVEPTPPAMTDMCGNAIAPVVTIPADIPCEGAMAWVFTYTDCAGNTADWTYTYTIDLPAFTLPVNDASTVDCLVDAQVAPTPPVMTDFVEMQ